ncbi:LacI family DNA-binding transcriptional regulator [Panacibacter sp. DH6]|uniref:LacI family DNA-binding transcriptional regulator n=1 Tax=Panacibacter microcysteis TaxID=2793269 RepID=A0A931GYD0_9BACT|nr:GntR family transcriptional regulator [Panacibacter microcysteis]MBG9375357.1 LacI family DNA-binding transcriptional regulator [Panacibacter microcysteis]
MQQIFDIDCARKVPKYLQIINSVNNSIKLGKLKKGDKILSINELSNEFFLSRDTVQKAYDALEEKGIILPIRGKGFYINRTDVTNQYRILLVFNKISNYKKQIYNAFVSALGSNAIIDLKIFHCNTKIFKELIEENLGEYDYYVIMPHFYEQEADAYKTIAMIPKDQLLVLDKDLCASREKYMAVFQDFQHDIEDALESGLDLFSKYRKLYLVYPKTVPYPYEIVVGFRTFCMQYNFAYKIIHEVTEHTPIEKGEAFVVIEETDLVNAIKICKTQGFETGRDVGLVSYNETPLKAILADGITVISTDHAKMGETAARLILNRSINKIKNPFHLIRRNSL